MEIKKISIDKIKPAKYNPRKNLQPNDAEYKKIEQSINNFGLVQPLVWNSVTGNLIGGHQRLKVLLDKGLKEVDCVVVKVDEMMEKALNLALNKAVGDWDNDLLIPLLQEAIEESWIDYTGFDENELKLLEELNVASVEGQEDEFDVDKEIESIEKPVTKLGDVVLLGEHRLVCGDATKKEDVELLMNGNKADMVFTDPPYGISFKSNKREKTKKFKILKNDDVILNISDMLNLNVKNNSALYICTRWDIYNKWFSQIEEVFEIKNCVVWNKGGGGLGDLKCSYCPTHEFIIVAHKGKKELNGKRDSDVWEIQKDCAMGYEHPTQKPIKLSTFAINHHSKMNDIILDLFGGSGSTLIACEQTKRKCYMMELDPVYCDVIIRRWTDFTGEKAERL